MQSVFKLLQSHGLSIIPLLEAKLNNSTFHKFMSRFPTNWTYFHNNDLGSKGRILLVIIDTNIWNTCISDKSTRQITDVMSNAGGF